MSTSSTISPTEIIVGHLSGSKKNEPRMAQSVSDVQENSAETCMSPPDSNYIINACASAGTVHMHAPFVFFGLPHILTMAIVASLGKYLSAPARVTTLQAAMASDNDMDIKECPN